MSIVSPSIQADQTSHPVLRLVDLNKPNEMSRLEQFVFNHPYSTPFHRPAWFMSVAKATGNAALVLIQEQNEKIQAFLPLNIIHSPFFGRVLVSSGFATAGGILTLDGQCN